MTTALFKSFNQKNEQTLSLADTYGLVGLLHDVGSNKN